jgi:periplasmic copper chaperone A
MKPTFISTCALLSILLISSFQAMADATTVTDAWVREGPPAARVLGGFMTISNAADKDDVLMSVSSSDFNMVEMHKTEMVDGVGRMILQERIVVPAGGQVVLKPGSYHLMLMKAQRPLKAGDSIMVELSFESGKQTIEMPVRKGEGMMMDHSHH